jgi:hypothetical protein
MHTHSTTLHFRYVPSLKFDRHTYSSIRSSQLKMSARNLPQIVLITFVKYVPPRQPNIDSHALHQVEQERDSLIPAANTLYQYALPVSAIINA